MTQADGWADRQTVAHAGCVALAGAGALILGAPGAGKSRLALELIALGAALVSDDRTVLSAGPGGLVASAPTAIAGLIEARGVGLLRMPCAGPTPVRVVVDLDVAETERLPPRRARRLCGVAVPLILGGAPAAAVIAVLRHGLPLDPDVAGPMVRS